MPPEKKGKRSPLIVIDANIWVSAFISPTGYSVNLLNLWLDQQFEVVATLPLLEEIARVLQKPRLQSRYEYLSSEIKRYLTFIKEGAIIVTPSTAINLCRDPKDNYLLDAAIEGRADFIITRDDDLKGDHELITQMKQLGVQVMTLSNFFRILKGLQTT